MNRPLTDQGQRVKDPATISGDEADVGEQDPQNLKDTMQQDARGSDTKLKQQEDQAGEDLRAIKPDHRQNDAGQ